MEKRWYHTKEWSNKRRADLMHLDVLISVVMDLEREVADQAKKIEELEKAMIFKETETNVLRSVLTEEEIADMMPDSYLSEDYKKPDWVGDCKNCDAAEVALVDGECQWCAAGGYEGENKILDSL